VQASCIEVDEAASRGGHLMDIEKLIEQLRWWADHCDRTNYGCHTRAFLLDAATAISTLQAENEKLRAELEQVKQELDEAREAICTHCMDFPCREESCYWWRGPKEG